MGPTWHAWILGGRAPWSFGGLGPSNMVIEREFMELMGFNGDILREWNDIMRLNPKPVSNGI